MQIEVGVSYSKMCKTKICKITFSVGVLLSISMMMARSLADVHYMTAVTHDILQQDAQVFARNFLSELVLCAIFAALGCSCSIKCLDIDLENSFDLYSMHAEI